jgi:hypothetical protein
MARHRVDVVLVVWASIDPAGQPSTSGCALCPKLRHADIPTIAEFVDGYFG